MNIELEQESVDILVEEMRESIATAMKVLHYLLQLQERGVKFVDENMEPVVPDNVLLFPGNREIH